MNLRKGYDEGLSLCRPMYYDYPEAPEAYSFRSQYMFGDDMLIAPVTSPAVDGFAAVDVWLPEGQWYELHTGTLLQGGSVVTRHFALDEYGIYVKAGSVLPFYGPEVNNLDGNDESVTLTVFPGGNGAFRLYEDAGNDKDYASEYAFTSVSNTWDGAVQTIVIEPREGSYEGMPAERRFKVKVVSSSAPVEVKVCDRVVDYEYLPDGLSFVVDIPVTSSDARKVVQITYASDAPALADGFVGLSRRMARSIEALKFRTGADPIDDLAMMGTINEAVLYDHTNAPSHVEAFMKNWQNLPFILAKQGLKEDDIQWFLQHCGWNN